MTSSHFLFLPVPALAYTGFWVHFKRASLEETRHSESLIDTCSKIIWTIDIYIYIFPIHISIFPAIYSFEVNYFVFNSKLYFY